MSNQYSRIWTSAALFFCLVLTSTSGTEEQGSSNENVASTEEEPVTDISHYLPELDLENTSVRDVKVNVGEVAYLPCRFAAKGTEVSWVRRSDWHILTIGTYSYTTDVRFSLLHKEGSDDWTLQLKYVDIRDNGTYVCQMYKRTGGLFQYVNLHVNKPTAVIQMNPETHVQEGETVTIVCDIQQTKPPFVFWYHDDMMVNYEGDRERILVKTEVEGSKTRSTITIRDVRYSDTGNYSCVPPNVEPASVTLYVSQGDNAAAVHGWGSSASNREKPNLATHLLLLTFVVCQIFDFDWQGWTR